MYHPDAANYGAVLRVLRGTYQILLTPCLWTQ